MVTIKTATFLNEISVARTFLEDNGIQCFVKDENLVQVHPAATSQGMQLQVPEEDVERALELLLGGGFATIEEYKEYSDPLTRFVDKIISKFK